MKVQFRYNSGIKVTYELPDKLQTDDDYKHEEDAITNDIDFIGEDKAHVQLKELKKMQEEEITYYTQALGVLKIIFLNDDPSIKLIDTIVKELHTMQALDDRDRLREIVIIPEETR